MSVHILYDDPSSSAESSVMLWIRARENNPKNVRWNIYEDGWSKVLHAFWPCLWIMDFHFSRKKTIFGEGKIEKIRSETMTQNFSMQINDNFISLWSTTFLSCYQPFWALLGEGCKLVSRYAMIEYSLAPHRLNIFFISAMLCCSTHNCLLQFFRIKRQSIIQIKHENMKCEWASEREWKWIQTR